MSRITRRQFIKSTGSAVAGASLILCGTRASGAVMGANDRLRIAVAGLHGRGQSHIDGWLGQDNVEIAYLIDPDQKVLDGKVSLLERKTEGKQISIRILKLEGKSDFKRVRVGISQEGRAIIKSVDKDGRISFDLDDLSTPINIRLYT